MVDEKQVGIDVCTWPKVKPCNFTWREMGYMDPPRRCTRPWGHDGRHEMRENEKLTLISWYEPEEEPEEEPNERVAAARERIAKHLAPDEPKVKRVPVDYLWSKLNWDFLKLLAQIAQYAEEKYGSAEQYMNARLTGEKDPINHAYEHLRQYQAGEPHDKFGDVKWHLAAAAYNLMMAHAAHVRWGWVGNPVMKKMYEKDGAP